MEPVYGCDAKGGSCINGVCAGECTISGTGWAIIGGSVAVLIAIIVGISCCCCGCSQCCRGGGGTKLVYIASARQEAAEQGYAFLGAQQDQYNPRPASPGRDLSRDPRFAKVGSA